jgi:ribosomal protein S18 acetylase RimI-like enzyme
MDVSIRVRRLTRNDLKACIHIVHADPFYRSYGIDLNRLKKAMTQAVVAHRNRGAGYFLGAFQGKLLVGFAWFTERGGLERLPYLRMIAVGEHAKGRGVGRTLLAAFEKTHGRGLMLLVTQTNRAAILFYKALGFKFVGTLRDFVRKGTHERLYWRSA